MDRESYYNKESGAAAPTLERIHWLNQETDAIMYPEGKGESEAGADIEAAAETGQPAAPLMGLNPADFPDGGLEAWVVVAGGWCALFCSFGWINCIGIFQEYYQHNLLSHLSPSTISWIPSLETFTMFAGGPVFGKTIDNYGVRWLLFGGSIAHVFGLMSMVTLANQFSVSVSSFGLTCCDTVTSLSTKYYQFILAQGIVSSLGASAIFYSAMSSVPTWFFKKRATAFGIMASGSSLAGIVLPIMVVKLIPQIGFPWTMRAVAFTLMGMLVIANLTIKSRLKPNPKSLEMMEFITPLKEPPYTLTVLASSFFAFGIFLPFTYIILQGQKNGMSIDLSQYLVPILNAASVFGRILPGIIADSIGRFNVTIITCTFSAVIVLALWLPSRGSIPIIIFSALYGFSSGAFVSLVPSLIAQISDVRQIGVRSGTLFACISVGALTGSPIGGVLVIRDNGSFSYLQIFCGLCMAIGSVLFLAAKWVQCGWAWKKI